MIPEDSVQTDGRFNGVTSQDFLRSGGAPLSRTLARIADLIQWHLSSFNVPDSYTARSLPDRKLVGLISLPREVKPSSWFEHPAQPQRISSSQVLGQKLM